MVCVFSQTLKSLCVIFPSSMSSCQRTLYWHSPITPRSKQKWKPDLTSVDRWTTKKPFGCWANGGENKTHVGQFCLIFHLKLSQMYSVSERPMRLYRFTLQVQNDEKRVTGEDLAYSEHANCSALQGPCSRIKSECWECCLQPLFGHCRM